MPQIPDLTDPRYLDEVGWFLYHERYADQFGGSYDAERLAYSRLLLEEVVRYLGRETRWIEDKAIVKRSLLRIFGLRWQTSFVSTKDLLFDEWSPHSRFLPCQNPKAAKSTDAMWRMVVRKRCHFKVVTEQAAKALH
jgi:hypothetical protein